jgi:hypothetical protein
VGKPEPNTPQETSGGDLWSRKRNANEAKNHFYKTMREVVIGDFGFFVGARLAAIGISALGLLGEPGAKRIQVCRS